MRRFDSLCRRADQLRRDMPALPDTSRQSRTESVSAVAPTLLDVTRGVVTPPAAPSLDQQAAGHVMTSFIFTPLVLDERGQAYRSCRPGGR